MPLKGLWLSVGLVVNLTPLQVGKQSLGLSEHQVAAVMGWTIGDYRLINPIARGQEEVEAARRAAEVERV